MTNLEIIPVIDLRQGQVVHARMGQRANYQPIRSTLCPGSSPIEIGSALLALHPFPILYAADLDAIQGSGNNDAALRQLRQHFPEVMLWVDAGFRAPHQCLEWLRRGIGDLVLGSESQSDWQGLQSLIRSPEAGRVILSLDYSGDRFLGPEEVLDTALWPARAIVMTLARVGSAAGPDLRRLQQIRARNPDCKIYAAGGVRDVTDLESLAEAGAAGVLVASALHDGRLGPDDLSRFAGS